VTDVLADTRRAPETAALAATLRASVMRLSRRIRFERAGDDLTLTQLSVLGTLAAHGPLPIGEIAARENVKPPSMTRTVAFLEELALVSRRPSPSDGRQVVVELTDEARAVLEADRRRRDAWLAKQLSQLDRDEVALLRKVAPLLERLAVS
jgi:DNA-binding MarR family transcriptional regulator